VARPCPAYVMFMGSELCRESPWMVKAESPWMASCSSVLSASLVFVYMREISCYRDRSYDVIVHGLFFAAAYHLCPVLPDIY
jgi:hypothetical protein